jgi:hypothetical protein
VPFDDVLIAIVGDPFAADRRLRAAGFTDERLRCYTSDQMLDEASASESRQGLLNRIVGTVVEQKSAIEQYMRSARDGRGAVWVHVAGATTPIE